MKQGIFRRLSLLADLLFLLLWKIILLASVLSVYAVSMPVRLLMKCAKVSGLTKVLRKIPVPDSAADMFRASKVLILDICIIPLFASLNNSADARRLFFISAIPGLITAAALSDNSIAKGRLLRMKSCTASYYDRGFAFRKTANGEIYNPLAMTAAHRTLPFNTLVLVRGTSSGREAVVRINDRGPFIRGRDIDLSRAAAEKLKMRKDGLATVDMWVISR